VAGRRAVILRFRSLNYTFNEETMTHLRTSTRGLLAVLATMTIAACASGPETNEPPPEGTYVTGSNIPRRDSRAANGVQTVSPEALQRAGTGPAAPGR